MSIPIKSERTPDPFARIRKKAIHDARLSWRARGILCFVLSLNQAHRTSVAELIKASPSGSQNTQTGLQELSELGYADLQAIRDKHGHIRGRQWMIYDRPKTCEKLSTDKPESGL